MKGKSGRSSDLGQNGRVEKGQLGSTGIELLKRSSRVRWSPYIGPFLSSSRLYTCSVMVRKVMICKIIFDMYKVESSRHRSLIPLKSGSSS